MLQRAVELHDDDADDEVGDNEGGGGTSNANEVTRGKRSSDASVPPAKRKRACEPLSLELLREAASTLGVLSVFDECVAEADLAADEPDSGKDQTGGL